MLNDKQITKPPTQFPDLEVLTPAEQLQLKGGTDESSSQADIIVEDVVNL